MDEVNFSSLVNVKNIESFTTWFIRWVQRKELKKQILNAANKGLRTLVIVAEEGEEHRFKDPSMISSVKTYLGTGFDVQQYKLSRAMLFQKIDEVIKIEWGGLFEDTNDSHSLSDEVDHPNHYQHGGIETIDLIEATLSEEEFIGFLKGNILKYRERAGHKGDAETDYSKAKWYYDRLHELTEMELNEYD